MAFERLKGRGKKIGEEKVVERERSKTIWYGGESYHASSKKRMPPARKEISISNDESCDFSPGLSSRGAPLRGMGKRGWTSDIVPQNLPQI